MSTSTNVAATVVGITQTLTVWTLLLPPISEVRENTPGRDVTFATDMRQSEAVAGLVAVTVGAIMSRVEGSYNPLIASIVMLGTLMGAYEYVLCQDRHRHLTLVRDPA